jgi:hypothetical protein
MAVQTVQPCVQRMPSYFLQQAHQTNQSRKNHGYLESCAMNAENNSRPI